MSSQKSYPSSGSGRADDYQGTLPARLPNTVVKELSTISPLRSLTAIAGEWAAIAIAIVLYDQVLHPLLLPLVVMWIGARQHALLILMHEGTHYLLFKNRTLNMVVSELCLAWPLFITTRGDPGTASQLAQGLSEFGGCPISPQTSSRKIKTQWRNSCF